MKKVWMVVTIGSLFALGALAETLSGTISDAACGAKHTAAAQSDAACVQSCVKKGEAPVLVSDGKVYKIAADSKGKVMPVRGQQVTVNGKLSEDTIDIESVSTDK